MIFLILFPLLSIAQRKLPPHLTHSNCNNLQYNTVADIWLDDSNYSQYLSLSDPLLLIASHKACKACCQHEQLYLSIKNTTTIKLARIDLALSESFLMQYNIKRFPYILYFNKGIYKSYTHPLDFASIMSFIHRCSQSCQTFSTLQQVEDFLARDPLSSF
jgi:hypothetical protein